MWGLIFFILAGPGPLVALGGRGRVPVDEGLGSFSRPWLLCIGFGLLELERFEYQESEEWKGTKLIIWIFYLVLGICGRKFLSHFCPWKKLLFPFWEKTLKWHAESSWDGRLGDGEIASYILNWGDGWKKEERRREIRFFKERGTDPVPDPKLIENVTEKIEWNRIRIFPKRKTNVPVKKNLKGAGSEFIGMYPWG